MKTMKSILWGSGFPILTAIGTAVLHLETALRVLSLCIGLAVGIITFVLKYREYREAKQKEKDK